MKQRLVILGILVLLIAAAGWFLHWQNNGISLSFHEHSGTYIPPGFMGFRILQVSDLHGKSFGHEQRRLMEKIRKSSPDVIVVTGDLIDSRKEDNSGAMSFIRQAVEVAPVLFVSGNHEAAMAGSYPALARELEEAGAVVLDNRVMEWKQNGDSIFFLGLMDPAFGREKTPQELAREAGDGFTILLAHRPEYIYEYANAGIHLVFAGHAHGGQFRLPFLGGLFSPGQGWLPAYDAGIYRKGNTFMVVSRGLGNSYMPVRLGNRPELVLVVLTTSP